MYCLFDVFVFKEILDRELIQFKIYSEFPSGF